MMTGLLLLSFNSVNEFQLYRIKYALLQRLATHPHVSCPDTVAERNQPSAMQAAGFSSQSVKLHN